MTIDGALAGTDLIEPGPARRLAGLLDLPDLPEPTLPPLWHWVFFLESAPQATLGPDGHPSHGVPSPPGPDYRRMFAGGRLTVHRPLRYGQPAHRHVQVLRTQEKQGRAGTLTFVTTGTTVEQDGAPALSEEQDIVYLPASSAQVARPDSAPAPNDDGELLLEFAVDPVVLFRFSALTYNAHRIHYDRDFALVEGHADIVVHGPLQALLMAEALRRDGVDLRARTFEYRLRAPAYGAQLLSVRRTGPLSLALADGSGRTTASARLAS